MEHEETVEDFLERVQQLDKQRQREDSDRRQRLKDDILSLSANKSSSQVSYSPTKGSIPQSESTRNFNATVSKEYRLNMDELVYESAYNYDKSRNKENQRPTKTSDHSSSKYDDEDSDIELKPASKSQSYRKYDALEIIRFDDFVTKNKKNPHRPSQQSSRYSKFELNDEEKKKMDETLTSLIGAPTLEKQPRGGEWTTSAKSKPSAPQPSLQMKRSPRKLDLELETPTRRDTSSTPTSPIKKSPAKVGINDYINEREKRPNLPVRPELRTENEDRPLLPVRPELRGFQTKNEKKPEIRPKSALLSSSYPPNTPSNETEPTPEKSTSKPQVRPKSTWLESTLRSSTSTPQGTPDKPLNISHGTNSWLQSAARGSTSTSQGLKTTTNFTIEKNMDNSTWLNSAKSKTTSTPKVLDTTSKIKVSSQDGPGSWLTSAKKLSTAKSYEEPVSKIAPIVPSKSNTLSQILEQNELSKSQQEKTLKELTNAKLNHIDSLPSPPKTAQKDDLSFEPITLKKTRGPPVKPYSKSTQGEPSPELTSHKLKPAVPTRKPSVEVPEALNRSKTLKPATPARKVSLEVPEALKKSQALKPAVPLRKPSLEVPEALSKKGSLKGAKPLPEKERVVPEGLQRGKELKPAPPKRKVSTKELEALSALNKLKKSDVPEVKAKPRVISQSKEVLNQKLQALKPVKDEQDDKAPEALDKRAMLERVLQRAQTAPNPMLMAKEEEIIPSVQLKKASTFDSSKSTNSEEMLTHPNKSRSKGPKRRTPKLVN